MSGIRSTRVECAPRAFTSGLQPSQCLSYTGWSPHSDWHAHCQNSTESVLGMSRLVLGRSLGLRLVADLSRLSALPPARPAVAPASPGCGNGFCLAQGVKSRRRHRQVQSAAETNRTSAVPSQSEIAGQFTNGYENNEPGRLHVVLNYQEQQSRKQSDQQNQSKKDARVGSAKQLVQSFSRCGQGTVHARQINGEQNKIHKQQPVFEVGKKAWSWLSAKFVYRHRQRGSAQSRIHQEQQREQMRPPESNARGRVHDEPIVEHNDDRRENGDGCGRAVQPAGQLPRGPEDAR